VPGSLRDLRGPGRAIDARPGEHDVAGQREQHLRHPADVLVAHGAEYQDEGTDAAQVIGERARRRGVVGAVEEDGRAPGDPLQPTRPARGPDRVRRPLEVAGEAGRAGLLEEAKGHQRVVHLVGAR